jgi:formate hydrogenlyase subunit 3/multisubunit Na+/H+ antiporter MnhD subunit
MVITPPALGAVQPLSSPLRKAAWPVALGLVLLPFARRLRRARRWLQVLLLVMAGAAVAAGVSACGSFSYTPQNFSVTVAASSGNLSHTATVKLTVK